LFGSAKKQLGRQFNIRMIEKMTSVLSITSTVADASAFQALDGSVAIVPFGGTAPYSFLWSNGATTSTVTVGAGVYIVTVNDANNLTLTESFTVEQPINFNVDSALPDTGLLSDVLCRDLYSRQINTNAQSIVGRTAAVLSHSLFTSSTSYKMASTFRTVFEGNGTCGQYLSPYDAAGVAHDVVHITTDGVQINGNLLINGGATQVQVNEIVVNDKLIVLQQNADTLTALDGTGVQFGKGELNRNLLYKSATDALVWSGKVAAAEFASGTNKLSPSNLIAASAAGSIVLNDFGFTITNAKLVNAVPTTAHIMTNGGVLVRATGQLFGYSSGTQSWNTSGDPIAAGGFSIFNGPSFTSSSVSYASANSSQNTFGTNGLVIGGSVSCTNAGVDIVDQNACLYFGNRAWRISYDSIENALNFEKLENGTYISKLVID